ncbi:MAG: hypothetical protein LBQ12_06235, partial [Deltaproteobacteria bacterium]|nr:hypothetical protein [Deltaproteobacteria bacterium]
MTEAGFQDVALNRRILPALLPAMKKSPAELRGPGTITSSSVRAAASVGAGGGGLREGRYRGP